MRSDEGSIEEQLAALESGALDLCAFPHAEHLRLAYEMLARHPFSEGLARYSGGLRKLTAKIGKPEVYHETLTVAFLALIGERQARGGYAGWREFIAANPDLLDKRCVEQWYTRDELASGIARMTFCLPRHSRDESS
jgi:hypothetical protein